MAERLGQGAEVRQAGESGTGTAGRALALGLLLFALVLWLITARHQPPAPLAADAPQNEFSAGRARAVLADLLGDGRPHPVGSPANAAVRQRILDTLTRLGYQPKVEDGFGCHPAGDCGRVQNIVARLEGQQPGAVALTSHYDSVGAGPGASDDMSSVAATLEIARILKAGPPPLHPVLLLMDEGEETGLLGAAAFEASSPEAREVKAVVNIEARGTEGASFLFETSGDNAWMISRWAEKAKHPVTTSLAAAIYKRLPNDTDLTVFRRFGVSGVNFAFIGAPTRYHTPDDNLANLSPASLQHQGDNALAAVLALAGAPELANPPQGDSVFFDVASFGVVRWPVGWTLPLAVLALLLVLFAVVAALGRRTLGGSDLVLGVLALPAMITITALVAFGLSLALRATGTLAATWVAHPLPALAAFWFLSLVVVAALAPVLGRRREPLGLWAGIWLVWSLIGVAVAVTEPAMSYVFVLPTLAAGLCGVLGRIWRGAPGAAAVAVLVPALVAALVWFGILPTLYDGLGVPAMPVDSVLLAVVLSILAPLVATGGRLGRGLWLGALALTLLAVVSALAQPKFSPGSPQPITFFFYQENGAATASWVEYGLPPLPAAVQHAAAFGAPGPAFPWSPSYARSRRAPAPVQAGLAAPELQLVSSSIEGGKRHLRLHLTSRRGAGEGQVWIPGAARPEEVRIDGHPVPAAGWHKGGGPAPASVDPAEWVSFGDSTLPAAGCDIEMVLAGVTTPLDWYVVDDSPGLPPSGAALQTGRGPGAVPIHAGDQTLVSRKVKI